MKQVLIGGSFIIGVLGLVIAVLGIVLAEAQVGLLGAFICLSGFGTAWFINRLDKNNKNEL